MKNSLKKSLALIMSLIIIASLATVPASAVNIYEEDKFMGLIEIYDYGNEEDKNFFQKIADTFHWYIARLFIYFEGDCPFCGEHFAAPYLEPTEDYYNKAINDLKAYKGKVTVEKIKTVNIETSDATVQVVKSIIDPIAENLSKTTKTTYVFENGIDSEGIKITDVIQPLGRYAQLTNDGVYSSTASFSEYGEKIRKSTIYLISETSDFNGTVVTNPVYNSTVIEPINPAALEISPVIISAAELTYPETSASIIFDDEGNAKTIKISIPIDATFTGKAAMIAFTAECQAKITEEYTVTYA